MRYLPVCAPELIPPLGLKPEELTHWLAAVPTIRFDDDDALPGAFAQELGVDVASLRAHLIPSNREYFDAVRAGLGWSVLPEGQVTNELNTGAVVRLPTPTIVHVPLYWHRWRLDSDLR